MEFFYRVLEWLQRIIILYSCGEEAIPSQLKPLLERAKVEPDGIIKSDCLMSLKGNIDAIYQVSDYKNYNPMSGSKEKDNYINKVFFTIYTSSDEYQTFPYEVSNGVMYWFIPKIMMTNIDQHNVENFGKIVEELYCTIIGKDYNRHRLYLVGKEIPIILARNTFINTTFNVDESIFYVNNEYLDKAVFAYLKRNVDFNNCNLTETLKEYIEKFESGDDELISSIATEYNRIKDEERIRLDLEEDDED